MRTILLILLALSIPVFLTTTNIRTLALSPAFYAWGFERFHIGETLSLSRPQLDQIAADFIQYFQAPPGELNPVVQIGGTPTPLFNEREVAHMVDVQALMRTLARAQVAAGVVAVVCLVGLGLLERRLLGPSAGLGLVLGAAVTFAILVLLGAATFVDFSSLWTRFHTVAFRNDLWQLDLERDNLIRLFPPPFWEAATLVVAGMTAIEALLFGAIGWVAWSGLLAAKSAPDLVPLAPRTARGSG